jgi:hypothetical protein
MLNSVIDFKYLIALVTLIVHLQAELSPLQIGHYDISLVLDPNYANTFDLKVKARFSDTIDINVCFQ